MDILKFLHLNFIPIAAILIPSLIYLAYKLFYTSFYRYIHYSQIPRNGFTFKGIVNKVGDGDGFKVVHIPALRSNSTKNIPSLSVRLAAIDAPEVRYFDRPDQPFAQEARLFLKKMIFGKKVYVKAIKLDLYNRILAIVYVRKSLFQWKIVNLEMIKAGLACVYESSYTTFGGMENIFRREQEIAKYHKRGMWKDSSVILPMEFKKIHRKAMS